MTAERMTKMTKFTPGPWTFRDCTPEETNNKYEGLRFMVSDKYENICRTTDGAKQAEVNARLIATAPDLLATCQFIKEHLHHLEGDAIAKKSLVAIIEYELETVIKQAIE